MFSQKAPLRSRLLSARPGPAARPSAAPRKRAPPPFCVAPQVRGHRGRTALMALSSSRLGAALGKPVRLTMRGGAFQGVLQYLSPDRRLLLRTGRGRLWYPSALAWCGAGG